jgi:hypothetical protein
LPSCSGRHDGKKILLPIVVLASANPADLSYVNAKALLDTGATCSALSPSIISKLALASYEKRYLLVATEDRLVDFYQFRIGIFPDNRFEGQLPFVFSDLDGFATRVTSTFDVILGMDVLRNCDLSIKRDGSWSLSFS